MSSLITRIPSNVDATCFSPRRLRVLGIELALALNAMIVVIARLAHGHYPRVRMSGDVRDIGAGQVLIVTLLVGLASWGLLALLERRTGRTRTIWTAIALAVLVISLLGPLGSGADAFSKLVLTGLHLGTGAVIIPLMRQSATNRAIRPW